MDHAAGGTPSSASGARARSLAATEAAAADLAAATEELAPSVEEDADVETLAEDAGIPDAPNVVVVE